MKNLLMLMLALSLAGCAVEEHDSDKQVYQDVRWEESVVYTEVQVPDTTYPKNAMPTFLPVDQTYMANLTENLQKAFAKTDAQIEQKQNDIIISLPHEVAFGTNQTTLDPQFEPVLSAAAKVIKEYDRTKIKVLSYTGNVGSVASNKALSLRRANAISNYLRLNGVNINRIVVDGLGQENPLNTNKTEAERKKNHRTEIILTNMQ